MYVGPPGAGVWTLPVGLMVTILSGTFISIGRTTRTIQTADPALITAAKSAQRVGRARVEAITGTGTTINERRVCDVDLVVAPVRGSAYRTRSRMLLAATEMPRFQPGVEFAVAILADGEPDVAPIDGVDARILDRAAFPRSTDALPVRNPGPGQLKADGTRRKPLISMDPATRWMRVPLYLVALVVAAVAVMLPFRTAVAQTFDALMAGQPHPDYRDGEIIADALEQLDAQTGADEVFDARIMADTIWFTVPVSDGAVEADDWWYRGGVLEKYGVAAVQPEDAREQFPLADVAWDALAPTAESAADRLGIDGLGDGDSITVSRTYLDDPDSEDHMEYIADIVVTYSLSDAYHSYSATSDAAGGELTIAE